MQPLAATPDGVDDGAWTEACADVRAYCGWHIAPSIEEDLVLDGGGSPAPFGRVGLLLPSLHVTGVSAVTVDDVAVGDLDEVKVETRGVLYVPGACWEWPSWSGLAGPRSRVVATVTHGHAACPAELLGVLRDLVAGAQMKTARRSVVGPFAHDWSPTALGGSTAVLEAHAAKLGRYRIEPKP